MRGAVDDPVPGGAGRPVRLVVDGPSSSRPEQLAAAIAAEVRRLGREAVLVDARSFWRDASLRLEFGHHDVDAFYAGWVDVPALNREVLRQALTGTYLPALRDPATNRARRVPYADLPPGGVLVVFGELLLGQGLEFDLAVHLVQSASTRRRLMPPEWAWTLPAFDRYESEVSPGDLADIVVSMNDLNRPAMRWTGRE